MLGVCRGIQMVNVMHGGTLYQDLPTELPSPVQHHETPPYDKVAHTVAIRKGTPLYDAVGLTEMNVNSYHHQAVKQVGEGLAVAARPPTGSSRPSTCRTTHSPWRCSGTRNFPASRTRTAAKSSRLL